MISRRSTKALAEFYHASFEGSRSVTTIYGNVNYYYVLEKDSLYDFLYNNDFDAWFLNAAKSLSRDNERGLKELAISGFLKSINRLKTRHYWACRQIWHEQISEAFWAATPGECRHAVKELLTAAPARSTRAAVASMNTSCKHFFKQNMVLCL